MTEQKTEEELERIAEKKREAGRRLQEQAQRQRLEKVGIVHSQTSTLLTTHQMVRQEEELQFFSALKASRFSGRKADYEVSRDKTGPSPTLLTILIHSDVSKMPGFSALKISRSTWPRLSRACSVHGIKISASTRMRARCVPLAFLLCFWLIRCSSGTAYVPARQRAGPHAQRGGSEGEAATATDEGRLRRTDTSQD